MLVNEPHRSAARFTSHCSSSVYLKMASQVVCIILALQVVSASENNYRNEGFMDHLNTGMKFAQNLLGSESVALKVADFVVRAFQTANTQSAAHKRPAAVDGPLSDEEHAFEENQPEYDVHEVPAATPWRYLVRLLGLQPNQISAVAVNALVFVAQMITTFLASPRRPTKPNRSDDPTHWMLNKNSNRLQQLIATAKNESLTDLVEELIEQHDDREETSCIRLLVCKITPFVTRMQKAVFGKENGTNFNKDARGAAVLYRHLPTKEEINDRSDLCEKRFQDCNLNE